MDYKEALEYLSSLASFGIKPGLGRMEKLLDQLGNPHKQLACVHITGTTGEGSVTRMLAAILGAAGYKTGAFTSPHLVKWNERILLDEDDVSDERLAAALTKVQEAVERAEMADDPPTQFEVLTTAAFLIFAEEKVDIATIEVGMGGLLDSTNVITPLCSIITNVSFDHMDRCGYTLEDIAVHKAGIIKPGAPAVTAAESVALSTIIDKAVPLKAELYALRRDFTALPLGGDLSKQRFLFRQGDYSGNFELALGGDHQVANAALVVMAARLLADKFSSLDDAAIQKGLAAVKWPGRLEQIAEKPDTVLDGAHNVGGATALRNALNKYRLGQPTVFVMGMMRDKDIAGVVSELVQPGDTLFAVPADDSERAAEPEVIASFTSQPIKIFFDIGEAIGEARSLAGEDGLVVIAGSLYLAGRVKSLWTKEN